MALLATTACSTSEKITYPQPPSDATADNYFGTEVPDPYRPLENDTAPATLAWVEAEREITENYLDKIPFLKNQAVIYRSSTPDGKDAEVFLDPNTLSDDGTVALTGLTMSHDGKYVAYTISRSGSDWTEIFVVDAATAKPLPDHIEWAKFTDAAWYKDGFFYSAYDRPVEGKEFSNANENHRIYYHKMGTPQSADTIAFEDPKHPLHFHTAAVPENERCLLVFVGGQGFGEGVMVKDLIRPDAKWVTVEPSQNYEMGFVDMIGDDLYFTTSADAPRKRLVKIPMANPSLDDWQTVIPEAEGCLHASCRLFARR